MSISEGPELKIFQLPPETIETLWPSLRLKLKPALDRMRGLVTERVTLQRLMNGERQCWVAYHGADLKATIVTRILTAEGGQRLLEAILGGGDDRKTWQRPIVERLKKFMVDENCEAFRIIGRKGWERLYPEFKPEQIVLEYRP